MLEAVPQPNNWEKKSYNNKPYYLVNVPFYADEYSEVENYFDGYRIIGIERVQNPFQYGKYLLYRLQKNSPAETISFMPVSSSTALEMALRYNCDYRRLNYNKDMFFPTVSAAVSYNSTYNKLVVLQGLKDFSTHDSGRYPKFVVTYECL